jgi:hypothetical protein
MSLETKYLVFAGEDYYPLGGAFDYVTSFDDKDTAVREAYKVVADCVTVDEVHEIEAEWSNVIEVSDSGITFIVAYTNGQTSGGHIRILVQHERYGKWVDNDRT